MLKKEEEMKKLLLALSTVAIWGCNACSSPDEVDEVVFGFAVDYKNESSVSVVYCLNIKGSAKCDTLEPNEFRNYRDVVDSIIQEDNCCQTFSLESFKSLDGNLEICMKTELLTSEYKSGAGVNLSLYHVYFVECKE